MQGKVEIAGVNTAKLKVLKNEETMELLRRTKAGDQAARQELIEALTEMRGYLGADETELLELTDSALKKLSAMTDEAFAELELYPDFDSEDNAYDE